MKSDWKRAGKELATIRPCERQSQACSLGPALVLCVRWIRPVPASLGLSPAILSRRVTSPLFLLSSSRCLCAFLVPPRCVSMTLTTSPAMRSSTLSQRRRLIIFTSLIANVILLIASVHELRRLGKCERWAAPTKFVTNEPPTGDVVSRRVLELVTPLQSGYPAALERQQSSAAPHSSARSLLSTETVTEATPPRTLGKLYPAPTPSDALHVKDDLSDNPNFDLSSHEFEWSACPLEEDEYHHSLWPFCPETATSEQTWQMGWFGQHVVSGAPVRPFPSYIGCTHLPPMGYKWPAKAVDFPATSPAVHLPNLRIRALEDLTEFNRATPKNLYHFDAPNYDLDALDELELAERVIPFASKIRLMLDVGAGGGSLGLLIKKKYDVQTLSTVFADWPYCEYITERGGNCILMDVMEAMPAAKFSFDAMHVSWVYHGQRPEELRVMFHELNRVLRPGGYMWLRGGWSREQHDFLYSFLNSLGYVQLYNNEQLKPKDITEKIFFGPDHTLAYAIDWTTIFVKPIDKKPADDRDCGPKEATADTTTQAIATPHTTNNGDATVDKIATPAPAPAIKPAAPAPVVDVAAGEQKLTEA